VQREPHRHGETAAARGSRLLVQRYLEHRQANDVRLGTLIDGLSERLGKRLGLHVEIIPEG
jgi:hypothetical protein